PLVGLFIFLPSGGHGTPRLRPRARGDRRVIRATSAGRACATSPAASLPALSTAHSTATNDRLGPPPGAVTFRSEPHYGRESGTNNRRAQANRVGPCVRDGVCGPRSS